MNLHEYQAKQILRNFGVSVPKGGVAITLQEAEAVAKAIGTGPYVVKAQVHAGGRGKAGGIRPARDPFEVMQVTRKLIGARLVTPQTGPAGKPVSRVLVEEALVLQQELYVAVTIDRRRGQIGLIGCAEGGVEIEEVSARSPEKIHRFTVEQSCGFTHFQSRRLALEMGLQGPVIGQGARMILGLFRAFTMNDCTLAEINPLGVTAQGDLIALDAKMNIDDNALFRHPELVSLRDMEQEDPRDVEASRLGLNFVNLSGSIGCIANGAGLGMATLDILHAYGGEAANFLDAGAGASKEVVRNAFTLLNSDPKVKGILINMFGGITRCDQYAHGVVAAIREKPLTVPLVIRLEGTNVEMGRKILAESGLDIVAVSSMKEAAQKIVAQVGKAE
jgi:succinyl-CoA synthetase beta subunit